MNMPDVMPSVSVGAAETGLKPADVAEINASFAAVDAEFAVDAAFDGVDTAPFEGQLAKVGSLVGDMAVGRTGAEQPLASASMDFASTNYSGCTSQYRC